MGLGESISSCLGKYFRLRGRACRSEFWWFSLFSLFLLCIPFVNFLALFLLIPQLTVTVRRMHDCNFSGWWYGLVIFCSCFCGYEDINGNFAPNANSIFTAVGGFLTICIFISFFIKGTMGDNKFGPDPLQTYRRSNGTTQNAMPNAQFVDAEPNSKQEPVFDSMDTPPQKNPSTVIDELEKLVALKNKGAISEDEFNAMKQELLARYK